MQRLRILPLALSATLLFLATMPAVAQDPAPLPGYVLVDDMYLPEEVVVGDSGFTATSWTANQVPYAFNANVSSGNQAIALKAMAELSATAAITFVPRTNQPNWIVFNASNVNNSPVGMIGGAQTINITSWTSKFIVVHEVMHALGYVHEQCRPDRDTYVTINWANILSGQASNFQIVNGTTLPTGYDFLSIMQYGRAAFSSNTLDTITCNPAYSAFQTQIGNRSFMTTSDVTGLQNRYLTPPKPVLTSINPPSVATTTGAFTLHAFGSGFFEGSLNGSGVIGTRITWDGAQLATSFVDSGHVTAQIPANYISQPFVHTIGVTNPAPAAGAALATMQLSVGCSSGVMALAQNTPVTVTNGCQQFSITPSYNVSNVVAVSSPSDWDITLGTGGAAAGGNTCDFVVGSGFNGPGTITPTNGNLILYSGVSSSTLQHVTSTPLLTGTPTISSMNAGSIVRAFHYVSNASSYDVIDVAGPTNLYWKLIWAGNTFGWRGSTSGDVIAQGQCGMGPVTGIAVGPSVYTLVVYNNGGPLATGVSFTVSHGFDFTPAQLTSSGNILTIAQGAYSYIPFTLAALANRWNVVGVSSATDWDIQIGPAVSQLGGGATDYVLANGHLGSIAPVTGSFMPYQNTGGPSGSAQFAPTATMSSFPGFTTSYTQMLLCFEFNVTVPGTYDINVGGFGTGAGWAWDLHGPGNGSQWRARQSALASGLPANGVSYTAVGLVAGWHAVVLRHDGGPSSLISPSIFSTYSGLQTPALTSLVPASAPANSATFNMAVSGSAFHATSQVRWNGAAIPTTFVSTSQLTGQVASSLLQAQGSASVTVYTPSAGTSNAISFSIDQPVPVATSISPTQAVTGDPSLTVSVFGSAFSPTSQVRWGGIPLPTTFVNSGQVNALVDASYLLAQVSQSVTVFTPAPGGGQSGAVSFVVLDPVLVSVNPASKTAVATGSAPFAATLSGARFTPYSIAYANGVALPTTFNNATTLSVMIDPVTVTQATVPGAIGLVVANTAASTSNPKPMVINGGNNVGLIRTQPLAPAPGALFTLMVEGGIPFAPLLIVADLGNPIPVGGFPDLAANYVIGITEAAGSNGAWFPAVDGLGVLAPADGSAFDALGVFRIPGVTMPNPPLGVNAVIQAAYIDPNAPPGFRLTWALFVIHV